MLIYVFKLEISNFHFKIRRKDNIMFSSLKSFGSNYQDQKKSEVIDFQISPELLHCAGNFLAKHLCQILINHMFRCFT